MTTDRHDDLPHSMTSEPATDGWIVLTKNGPRPSHGQRVLVVDNGVWKQAFYLHGNDTFIIGEGSLTNVTHWRPVTLPVVPEPPWPGDTEFHMWWRDYGAYTHASSFTDSALYSWRAALECARKGRS